MRASKVEIYSFMASSAQWEMSQVWNTTTALQRYSLPGIQARIKCIQLIVHVRGSKSNAITRSFLDRSFQRSPPPPRSFHFMGGTLMFYCIAEITIALHCSRNGAIACPTSDCDTQYVTHWKKKLTRFTKLLLLSKVVNESRLEYFLPHLFTSEPLRVSK